MATNNACNFGEGTSGQVLTSNGAGLAPTFQAASNSALSNVAPWTNTSTSLYWTPIAAGSSTGQAATANNIFLIPIVLNSAITLTLMGVQCLTYASPDSVRLGVYSITYATGAATLVADFGTVSVSGTGIFSASSLTQALASGYYYFAVNISSASNRYAYAPAGVFSNWIINNSVGQVCYSYGLTYGALPSSIAKSTLDSNTASSCPTLFMQGS